MSVYFSLIVGISITDRVTVLLQSHPLTHAMILSAYGLRTKGGFDHRNVLQSSRSQAAEGSSERLFSSQGISY